VSQHVESDGRDDLGLFAGVADRPGLVRMPPHTAIRARKQKILGPFPGCSCGEKSRPSSVKCTCPALPALAPCDGEGAAVGIVVSGSKRGELAVPRSAQQSAHDHPAEIHRGAVHQALASLSDR
jgi:hypothetical protein